MSKYILVNPESLKDCLKNGDSVSTAIIFSAIPENEHHIAFLEEENAQLRKHIESFGGKVPMPRELTAENGAKAALMGEFHIDVEVENPDYCGCGECDYCLEVGKDEPETVIDKHPVSWTTIKDIYKLAVELFNG